MGKDSGRAVLRLLRITYTIMLALTSNEGAFDFQTQNDPETSGGKELYKVVLETSKIMENAHNLMYVVVQPKPNILLKLEK